MHSVVLTSTPHTIILKETTENRETAKKKARNTKKESEQFVSSAEKGNLSIKISFRKFFRI
jgi:hypothetical protein